MNKNLAQVQEWSRVFKRFISETPNVEISKEEKDFRIKLIQEEFDELKEALANNDLVEAFDALLDLEFVLHGTTLALGLQHHTEDGFEEVYRSNMTKIDPSTGKPNLREDGKILKGDYFEPPDLKKILFPEIKRDVIYRFKKGPYKDYDFYFVGKPGGVYRFQNFNLLFPPEKKEGLLVYYNLPQEELWRIYVYKSS